jgi:hypothetical protein
MIFLTPSGMIRKSRSTVMSAPCTTASVVVSWAAARVVSVSPRSGGWRWNFVSTNARRLAR